MSYGDFVAARAGIDVMFVAFVFSGECSSRFMSRLIAFYSGNDTITPTFCLYFVLYWFSSIASLSSPFSDGINGAVVDVSYHINSTLAGHVASIQALLLPLSPRAVGTCGR